MHASKVVKLIYTNSGVFVLALTSNALHKLWKWPRSDRNPSGKMWQPASGIVMNNDVGDTNPEVAACIALSENDSYVMSASCGKVSLFNMMAFKVMKTFMPPLPAATFLPSHPQDNNIIAIGMEDSSIQIYTVRVDEVKAKLQDHQKKITGLAFSRVLNVLVSSGADAQMRGTSEGQKLYNQEDLHHQWGIQEYSFIMIKFTCWLCMRASFAIYDASKLERLCYCSPHGPLSAPISSAIYSCDSVLVYASF